jgi:hypothetical protein
LTQSEKEKPFVKTDYGFGGTVFLSIFFSEDQVQEVNIRLTIDQNNPQFD